MKRYIVEMTARETFSSLVEANNKKDAAEKARNDDVIETWPHNDRQISGVKRVCLDPDSRAE